MSSPRMQVAMEGSPSQLVREVARSWRRLLAGGALGAIAGGAVVLLVPPRFRADALVLIRTQQEPTAALASRASGPLTQLAPFALGPAFKDELETEVALLKSRAVASVVTDSLGLQLRLREPDRVPPGTVVDSVRTVGRFAPATVTLRPGRNAVPGGAIWVRADAPAQVHARLVDREDAIDDLLKRLEVKKAGGEVVRITFTGRDSLSSAAVPNLVIATYLARRRTVDRGINQRRFEFLASASDSIVRAVGQAVDTRRRLQDASQVPIIEPAVRALVEQTAELESRLGVQRAEELALDSLLSSTRDPRQLATVPALLRSPLVNELVGELARLDVRRATLLVSLPPTAPAVTAVESASDSIRAQLQPLARTYLRALATERRQLERDLTAVRGRLRALPGAGAALYLAESRLGQLSALDNSLGGQVLQARLAAIAEGGDVRVVDAAVPPRKVAFPRPLLTVAGAGILGVVLALALVLVSPPAVPDTRA